MAIALMLAQARAQSPPVAGPRLLIDPPGNPGIAHWDGRGLTVPLERSALRRTRLAVQKRAAMWIGNILGRDTGRQQAVLDLPPTAFEPAQRQRPLVVLLHGYGDGPWRLRELATWLGEQNPQQVAGTYTYANDAPIDELGRELAGQLVALTARDPRPIVLIGYSMGGLVARYAIETRDLAHGNVRQLIQIGTPNRGTHLAWLAWLVDARHLLADPCPDQVQALVADGLNEAGWDLRPGSTFLDSLNSQPRNPHVDYHLVLGSGGPMSGPDWLRMESQIQERLDGWGIPHGVRESLHEALSELAALTTGRGDGVVSLHRGALEGVQPLVVPMSHREMMRAAAEQPVFAAVQQWIDHLASDS